MDFENLYTIKRLETFFVVIAKTNIRLNVSSCKRRLPENIISIVKGTFIFKFQGNNPKNSVKLSA